VDRAVLIDRAREDAIAGSLGHGAALAREHRLVDARRARFDAAVDGNPLPGPNDQTIAHAHLRDRDLDDLAVSQQPGTIGLACHQRPDRVAGVATGTGLEKLPDHHQRDDHRCRLEVDGEACGVEAQQ
jgi:hypothetical protein